MRDSKSQISNFSQKSQVSPFNPWFWVPSLYYAEGLPYVAVMTVSVIMYKRLGISNTDIALYTSWLYLPWVIKPLWSPVVDIFRTKRFWIFCMQLIIGATFACVALTIPAPNFFKITLAFFWLLAFNSATHDIAADGFYILGLDTHQQAWFVGIRSTFYRLSMITGQGALVIFAGGIEKSTGNIPLAWSLTFFLLAALFVFFGIYHCFILPCPERTLTEKVSRQFKSFLADFAKIFISFFAKKGVIAALAFLLLYRLGEAQLIKLALPFMLDPLQKDGLGLSTTQVGFAYGTVGLIMLTVGGILGGIAASSHGLKKWIWVMAFSINLPHLLYVYLSQCLPENFIIITICVGLEQFGYGFGFAAYMLFMVYFAEDSAYKASHYAIMTGFMALGMMIPGMWSGWLQNLIGYRNFFIWVCLCFIPCFIAVKFVKLDREFGKKKTG